MSSKKKKQKLRNVEQTKYRIYGIFDFENSKLVKVSLDYDQLEFEFDLDDYDEEQYDVVSFDIMVG